MSSALSALLSFKAWMQPDYLNTLLWLETHWGKHMHALAFCCKLFYFNGKQKEWSHFSPPSDADVRISSLTAWMTRAVVFPQDRAIVRFQCVPTNVEGENLGLLPIFSRCFHALAWVSCMFFQLHFVLRRFCLPSFHLLFAQCKNKHGQVVMISPALILQDGQVHLLTVFGHVCCRVGLWVDVVVAGPAAPLPSGPQLSSSWRCYSGLVKIGFICL